MRKLLIGAVVLATVAGGVDYGRYWWTTGRFLESTDDAYVGGDVTVMAPRVSGFITEVAVTDNQPAKAGDLSIGVESSPPLGVQYRPPFCDPRR